jgi:hypothetical protein
MRTTNATLRTDTVIASVMVSPRGPLKAEFRNGILVSWGIADRQTVQQIRDSLSRVENS